MDKKAQGMSLKVIIIAVLALIILIVLVLIFTGKIKMFGNTASDTASQYSGRNCMVPGTNNDCTTEDECRRDGGAWQAPPEDGYEDCRYSGGPGCCMM
ncbi:hypothetical protein HQ545_08425 [Candidatus Woesearchaeota archaeon]|nr:hypothetical protein [Candidatus Woesearchaeota archaeon]